MKKTLLLADDSPTIQKVINLTFADEGIDVIAVSDGNAAIEYLRENKPDLVMADVHMPGLNGYQICERIRQNTELSKVPVILLVGSFEPFDEEEAKRVGADDFLMKPFQSIRQLVSRVAALLEPSEQTDISGHDTLRDIQVAESRPSWMQTDNRQTEAKAPEPDSSLLHISNSLSFAPREMLSQGKTETDAPENVGSRSDEYSNIQDVTESQPPVVEITGEVDDLAAFDDEFDRKFPDAAGLSAEMTFSDAPQEFREERSYPQPVEEAQHETLYIPRSEPVEEKFEDDSTEEHIEVYPAPSQFQASQPPVAFVQEEIIEPPIEEEQTYPIRTFDDDNFELSLPEQAYSLSSTTESISEPFGQINADEQEHQGAEIPESFIPVVEEKPAESVAYPQAFTDEPEASEPEIAAVEKTPVDSVHQYAIANEPAPVEFAEPETQEISEEAQHEHQSTAPSSVAANYDFRSLDEFDEDNSIEENFQGVKAVEFQPEVTAPPPQPRPELESGPQQQLETEVEAVQDEEIPVVTEAAETEFVAVPEIPEPAATVEEHVPIEPVAHYVVKEIALEEAAGPEQSAVQYERILDEEPHGDISTDQADGFSENDGASVETPVEAVEDATVENVEPETVALAAAPALEEPAQVSADQIDAIAQRVSEKVLQNLLRNLMPDPKDMKDIILNEIAAGRQDQDK